MNRRELLGAVSAFAMMASVAEGEGDAVLDQSRVFHFAERPVRTGAHGMETRTVVAGTLLTGEFVELHETSLPAGQMPHPPHRHKNSEFLLIREGHLQYLTDGKVEDVMPGDVIYTASMKGHGLRNVGSTMARYFVVSISAQPGSTPITLAPPAA